MTRILCTGPIFNVLREAGLLQRTTDNPAGLPLYGEEFGDSGALVCHLVNGQAVTPFPKSLEVKVRPNPDRERYPDLLAVLKMVLANLEGIAAENDRPSSVIMDVARIAVRMTEGHVP